MSQWSERRRPRDDRYDERREARDDRYDERRGPRDDWYNERRGPRDDRHDERLGPRDDRYDETRRRRYEDGHFREVRIEWLDQPKPENRPFIRDTGLKIATEYGCDLVRVRKEIHNTASAWEFPEMIARDDPTPSAGQHMKPRPAPRSRRDGKVRVIVDAPWHYTVEFRLFHSGLFFNAHVYADTKTAEIAGRIVEGIATGELTVPDGVEIPDNPLVFHTNRFPCANGKAEAKIVTNHFVKVLPRDELKVPPRRVPQDRDGPTFAPREPFHRRRETPDNWRREPNTERRDGPTSTPRELFPFAVKNPRKQVEDKLLTLNYD